VAKQVQVKYETTLPHDCSKVQAPDSLYADFSDFTEIFHLPTKKRAAHVQREGFVKRLCHNHRHFQQIQT